MGIRLSQAEIERRLRKEYGLRDLRITGEKAQILKDKEKKALGRAEAIKELAKKLSKHEDPRTRAEVMRAVFNLRPSIRGKVEKAGFEFKKEKDPKLVEKEIKTRIALGKASARLAGGLRENPEMTKEGIISRVHGGEKTSEAIGVKRQTGEVHAADDSPGKPSAISTGIGQNPLAGKASIAGRPGMASLGNRAAGNYPDSSRGRQSPPPRIKDPLGGRNIGRPGPPGSGPPGSGPPRNNPFIRKAGNL